MNTVDYRVAARRLKEREQELAQYGQEMSPYQRRQLAAELDNQRALAWPRIEAAARVEFETAVEGFKRAEGKATKARAAEAARWDPARFAMENSMATLALARAETAADVGAVWQAALDSGDIHKQRAVAEHVSVILAKFPPGSDDRLPANRLTHEARRKLEELKQTPDIIQAEDEGARVAEEVVAVVNDIQSVLPVLDPNAAGHLADMLRGVAISYHVDQDLSSHYHVELVDAPDMLEGGLGVDPRRVVAMTQGGATGEGARMP